jgi:hypothetical protein
MSVRRRLLGCALLALSMTVVVESSPPSPARAGGVTPATRAVIESDLGAYAVAWSTIDSTLYVVGNQNRDASSSDVDVFVRRYRSDGRLVWQRTYRTDDPEFARGVAVDASGAVYVAGWTATDDQGDDVLLLKYSPRGVRQWVRSFDSSFSGDDRAYGVAVDVAGRVWVAGTVPAATDGSSQVWWSRWTSAGRRAGSWTTEFSILGRAEARAVAALPDGSGIALAGNTFETIDGSVSVYQDAWASVIDVDGGSRWMREFGRAGADDTWHGVAVGPSGEVYVTGEAAGRRTGSDIVVRRYSPTGKVGWTSVLALPGEDAGRGIAVSPSGATVVIAADRAHDTFDSDTIVRAYTAPGGHLWTRRVDSAGLYSGDTTPDAGLGVVVPGPVIAVGRADPGAISNSAAALPWVARFAADIGTPRWARIFDAFG